MLVAILFGTLMGLAARLTVLRGDVGGYLPSLILGMVGSVMGYLASAVFFGLGGHHQLDIGGLWGSALVAAMVLGLYAWLIRRQDKRDEQAQGEAGGWP